jgi:hypothetical protein
MQYMPHVPQQATQLQEFSLHNFAYKQHNYWTISRGADFYKYSHIEHDI